MLKYPGLIFLFIIIFYASIFSQDNFINSDIADVGGKIISTEEFLERFEMTPQFRRHITKFSSSLKLQFLYTLIAEKLWAIEAERMQLDTTEAIKTALSSIEKLYVRDALFQEEIKKKINITDEKYIEGIIRNSNTYFVKYLFSSNKKEIDSLYSLLIRGAAFDSILSSRKEAIHQVEPKEINFGDLVENIEDEVYSLSVGEFTKVNPAEDGWYIFKVYDIKEIKRDPVLEKDQIYDSVKKILQQRVGDKLQKSFYENFFRDLKVDVESELFKELSQELSNLLNLKKNLRSVNSTNLLTIDAYDVLSLKNNVGKEKLTKNFINFSKEPISFNNFIDEFFFDGFQISPEELPKLNSKLNNRLKIFIEKELLAREGYRRNLQNSIEVVKYVKMWRDYYLSQAYLSNQVESVEVNEEEIKNFYEKEYKSINSEEQIKVAEILMSNENSANNVYNQLVAGKDFNKAVQIYSLREWTKKNNGVLGYFPISNLGEIGKVGEKLKINEISKPFKSKDGYSIVKLLGRKKKKVNKPLKTMEELKNSISRKIAFQKVYPDLVNATSKMANNFSIHINTDILNNLKVSNLNTFAIRIMGFGGKITAVPLQKPFTEWTEKWVHKPNLLP